MQYGRKEEKNCEEKGGGREGGEGFANFTVGVHEAREGEREPHNGNTIFVCDYVSI